MRCQTLPAGVASATVNSDLGSVYSIDHLALWYEEYSGINFLDISKSLDNINFIGEVAFSTSAVPIPAAIWLFGSSLLGLVGMARRKKSV